MQQLTLEEIGAYITLLAFMWLNGDECRIPDDNNFIARILHVSARKWSTLRKVLVDGPMPVFRRTDDGRLSNKRLDAEYAKTSDKIRKRSEAASKRWGNTLQTSCKSNANASGLHVQNDAIKDPDPESDPERRSEREIDARVRDMARAYEEVCGPLRGEPTQLMTLVDYLDRGMDLALVVHALRKSSTADHPAKYADAILRGYERRGITGVAQALEESAATGGVSVATAIRSRAELRGPNGRVDAITGERVGRV